MGFGKKLEKKMSEKGLKQADIVRATGISKTTLSSMINRDNTKVDVEIFIRICDALGCKPEDFADEILSNGDTRMKLVSNFNKRFKEAFGDRSVTEFAAEIGVSKQAISSYLNGTRKPKEIVTGVIANKLNVSPAWLMGYDVSKEFDASADCLLSNSANQSQSLTAAENQLLEDFRVLDKDGQAKLIALADDLAQLERLKKHNTPAAKSEDA